MSGHAMVHPSDIHVRKMPKFENDTRPMSLSSEASMSPKTQDPSNAEASGDSTDIPSGSMDEHISAPSNSTAATSSTKTFICVICGQSFTRAHDEKRHVQIHTRNPDEGPRCQWCKKKFSRDDALKRHLDHGCDDMPDEVYAERRTVLTDPVRSPACQTVHPARTDRSVKSTQGSNTDRTPCSTQGYLSARPAPIDHSDLLLEVSVPVKTDTVLDLSVGKGGAPPTRARPEPKTTRAMVCLPCQLMGNPPTAFLLRTAYSIATFKPMCK